MFERRGIIVLVADSIFSTENRNVGVSVVIFLILLIAKSYFTRYSPCANKVESRETVNLCTPVLQISSRLSARASTAELSSNNVPEALWNARQKT